MEEKKKRWYHISPESPVPSRPALSQMPSLMSPGRFHLPAQPSIHMFNHPRTP